ncbi:hypothetical protein [Sphingomonas faeni]|uniref:hypothetical protein n=1 Tax=Sphingomonas faeni TaxID=185950 RepID=UPI003345E681
MLLTVPLLRMLIARFAVFAVVAAVPLGAEAKQLARSENVMPFELRDGETEARGELAARKPLKLYIHIWNTRAPGFRTPGLIDCDPRTADREKTGSVFVEIPEAGWSEQMPFPPHFDAAVSFASHFNKTVFSKRRNEVLLICPKARLDALGNVR